MFLKSFLFQALLAILFDYEKPFGHCGRALWGKIGYTI